MIDPADRAQFLNLAGVFEGGLVFVALGLAWTFGIDLLPALQPHAAAVIFGVLAAIPPFALLVVTERFHWAPLTRIKELVLETLGPALAACRWYDLILLATLAGVGEELLFRGVIQPLFERLGPAGGGNRTVGLIGSNVIFGLLHLITPTYAVLAGAMGVYFGLLLDLTGSRNVIAPMLAHGLYDYLAFLVVISTIRKQPISSADDSRPKSTTAEDSDDSLQSPPPV